MKTKTIFFPCRQTFDAQTVAVKIGDLPYRRIGLVSTAQYVHKLPEIAEILGSRAIIGKGTTPNPGQVLGCNASAAKAVETDAECFVYIGDGDFHPLKVLETTDKPVYVLEPAGLNIRELDEKERMKRLKILHARVSRFSDARTIGIMVSTKPGQERMETALGFKKTLKDKKAFIFLANEINPVAFTGFSVDVWVNTACPRISDDKFDIPVVNYSDLIEILGEKDD